MEASIDLRDGEGLLSFDMDDSNAIMLPGKKNSIKKMNKVSGNQKKKRIAELSKAQKRKLKKLQEDKDKELLLSKSMETLEKYKIGDVAQSLMWSSKNLGQVETFQEKRRREVHFCKAGLQLPTNNRPIKRKTRGDTLEFESETKRLILRESCNVNNFTYPFIGDNESKHNDSTICGNVVADARQCKAPVPVKEIVYESCDIPVPSNDKNALPSNVSVPEGEKIMDRENGYPKGHLGSISNLVNGHSIGVRTAPIVVHVSRPMEIENTRKDLPIVMMEQEIMEAINENISVIICGETGCGKTTQVPQFLYEAGFGSSRSSVNSGMIGVTQPRRVAVLATAKRVALELGVHLGKEVGFQVRHDKRIGDNCSIKFMTDGILLRELQNDFLLKRYSVIILDEAHERSLNTDILLGMLSRIIQERQRIYEEQKKQDLLFGKRTSPENKVYPLKLVLMSATLRVEDFVSEGKIFSKPPPVIEVPARQYPVGIHFSKRTEIVDYVGQAYKMVLSIHKKLPPGGILVFVTGQREVEYLCEKLRKASREMVKSSSRRIENATARLEGNCPEDHDMNEISEAFEIEGDSSPQQSDIFSSYDDDYDDLSENESVDSFESDEDSDLEVFGKDGYLFNKKNMDPDDVLMEDGNLASLKAAFDALAGKNTFASNTDGKQVATDKGSDLANLSSGESTREADVPPVSPMCVLPLYAMLPASAQLRVFNEVKEGERLVVVATNVAETSLTIPGIKYVVDTGREKVKMYNSGNGMEKYEVQCISKASASQRAGRAGRTGPGHCYRLYSSAFFENNFSDFSDAEISKIPVDGVVLLMKSMGIDKVANFPFPTRPELTAINKAESCLKALDALDADGRLTSLGKAMAHYPMSPRHSRMLLTVIQILRKGKGYSRANLVLGYAIAAAAALSLSNPFITQFERNNNENSETAASEKVLDKEEKLRKKKQKEASRASFAKFCNPTSDALSIAYALQCFELSNNPINFCTEHALHHKTMEEMSKLRKQLLKLVFQQSLSDFQQDVSWTHGIMVDVESSWRDSSNKQRLSSDEEEVLGQAICAGWADRVAKKTKAYSDLSDGDKKVIAVRYQALVGETVFLHRRSSVSRSAPDFLVYSELLQTKRPYIYSATTVKPDWLVKYASSSCTFSAPHTDPRPYYEPLSDQVFCWRTPTFGPYHWQLPLHRFPVEDNMQRVAVFASSLIGGAALPCLKSVQEFLAAAPAIVLPKSLGHKRVRNLLSKLNTGKKTIDSCAMLREVWSENPGELYSEIQEWFQERFHDQFKELWAEMHREVLLDPQERFGKKGKKERSGKKDKSRKKNLVI
ncbi:ATP-dependent RNA helicase DEAH13-like isoform X1 [Apium graveolens]|uniref:ATP-dependent RNA helicase DEAH13-like isoform X1 n=2 Tax=Apium graveolens TaxID=4045 RepID=UPI003D7BB546